LLGAKPGGFWDFYDVTGVRSSTSDTLFILTHFGMPGLRHRMTDRDNRAEPG
jgi:hypothetical protein